VNRVTEKKDGGPPAKPHFQEFPVDARLVSSSAPAPAGLTSFTGLLARSAEPGRWQIYPSLDMSRSVEIAEEDIVHTERLPAEKSPFGSLGGTRIFVKKGAEVATARTVTWTQPAGAAGDEFDLDIRLGGEESEPHKICPVTGQTDSTCLTCGTCATQCDQHTCLGTQCNQATCNTCATQCNQHTCQATCQTCATQCKQHTCQGTCDTCATCAAQRCLKE
jgi:hypothetical protein